MQFEDLIAGVSEKLGVPLSARDGACAFTADGMTVRLNDIPEGNAIAVYGELGEPGPEPPEGLYEAMLEANDGFRGTAGATLSRSPETGKFALNRCLEADRLDVASFMRALELFLNAMESWRKILSDYRSGGADKPSRPDDGVRLADGFLKV